MALFKKNLRQRLLGARRNVPDSESWFARWFRRPGAAGSVAVALMFYLLAAGMDLWPTEPMSYRRGQYVPLDIAARVDFWVLSEPLMEKARQTAIGATPATFQLNTDLLDKDIIASLKKIPATLHAAEALEKVDPALRVELGLASPDKDEKDKKKIKAIRNRNRKAYAGWVALGEPKAKPGWEGGLVKLRESLRGLYLVQPDRANEQKRRPALLDVRLMEAGRDLDFTPRPSVVNLIGLEEKARISKQVARCIDKFDQSIRPGVRAFLLAKLTSQPMYRYDAPRTEKDKARAIEEMLARPDRPGYKHYRTGEVLAGRSVGALGGQHALAGISDEEFQLLGAEHAACVAAEWREKPSRRWFRLAGRAGIILMLSLLLCAYVVHYQYYLVERSLRGFTLAALLLMMLAVVKAAMFLPWMNPYIALSAVCVTGIILTIAYDQRFALAVGSIFSAFVVFQLRGDFGMLVVMLAGLILCVFQLHEIRTRSKLVVVSAISAVAVFVVVWAMSAQAGAPWRFALRDSLWAAGGIMLAGLVVQSLLPVIERIFNVATGSTLLEWCDASKPLLKRLAMESPGTYNHSLQLGAMCEAAAETIGARGLLGRVGAYYHDIGKIHKPEYFAENQAEGLNKHEKLSPAMSLLIIINHVKDGLEMAKKYGLPGVLREFIATHHGTTLVRYFYHAATQQSQDTQAPAPDENQYRYPGPKPHCKEAAILMLADGSESSVRAMSEPTPARIKAQVHEMVSHRLEDGQLDECELKLKEVHQIEESIVKSLCGMYHARISYPKDEQKNGAANANGKSKPPPTGENDEL